VWRDERRACHLLQDKCERPHLLSAKSPVNTVSRRLISSIRSAAVVIGAVSAIVCSPFVHHHGAAASRTPPTPPASTGTAHVGVDTFMATPVAATLPSALTGIQAAFLSNDASRLAAWFPRRGPVYVSVPPLETGTFLAPGPLKAFLDRLVRERVCVSLELPAVLPDVEERQTGSTFVKVKWTHRPPASSTLQVDYLHLALRYAQDDGEWRIVEIKTSLR
jgi:hypothetical protein